MAHPHNRTAFALSPADLATLLMVVVIKAVVLIYGVITYQILNNERLDSLAAYLEVCNRWDGPHYLDIARNGPRASYERCGAYIVNRLEPIYA